MAFENKYTFFDRLLHRIAFATAPAQTVLAELEEQLYKSTLAGTEVEKPVFVTALPRAGTTLLLELCVNLEEFSSHCYRDMPFILTPLIWKRFSARFRQSDTPRERAHGDGMMVSIDSPEAFEEVVWKSFWKEHYRKDRILPWRQNCDDEFSDFLRNHLRKIISLRSANTKTAIRYVSKNNLNIARTDILLKLFPDALFLVPFRHPLQHAASLLHQHLNFLKIHSQDKFARAYMAGIGHFDFGENLRPIDFQHWLEETRNIDATTLSFWLEYWHAAYSHLISRAGSNLKLFSYEAFCEQPGPALEKICNFLQIEDKRNFISQKDRISARPPHPVEVDGITTETLDKVEHLHRQLTAISYV